MPQCYGQPPASAFSASYRPAKYVPQQIQRHSTPTSTSPHNDIELNHLTHPSVIQVHLKQLRTSQFAHVNVTIGASGHPICLVGTLLHYYLVTSRGSSAGPLFIFQDGHLLMKPLFVGAIRQVLQGLGLNTSLYAGQSFRIGAATVVAKAGMEDSHIRAMGCWKSNAFTTYIHLSSVHLARLSSSQPYLWAPEYNPTSPLRDHNIPGISEHTHSNPH